MNESGIDRFTEARGHQRSKIAHHHRGGVFRLRALGRHFKFEEVDNVSVSGTGVRLPISLDPDTAVTLTYSEKDWTITISGQVAWSARNTRLNHYPSYHIGIRFDPENMQDNALFFMALREFIDPFTWMG